MAKSTVSVEKEVLKASGEEPQGKKEDRKEYLMRVIRAANDIAEDVWEEVSEGAQDWLESAINAVNKKKSPPDFPGEEAEDDEDAKPARPKLTVDEDEDEAPAKKPAKDDDEDEDAPPAKKPGKKPVDDDEDAPAPKPKKPVVDDDEDAPPAKKPALAPAKPVELTAEEKAARKAAIAYVRRLLVKNRERTLEDVAALLEKKEHELAPKLLKIYFDDTLAVLNLAAELGYLRDEPEAAE